MIDVLTGLFDYIKKLFEFLWQVIKGIGQVSAWLGIIPTLLPDFLSWLPAALVSTILVLIFIAIIYKILGRQT